MLEDISYRAILIAFPLDTMVIILGALWADVAWGSYWSWDPKEPASLFTWLIYGAYLHARVVRGWHGKRAAWLPGRFRCRASHLLRQPVLRRPAQLLGVEQQQ